MLKYYQPTTLEELSEVQWKMGACSDYLVVAGGTDVMVKKRETHHQPKAIIDLSHLSDLRPIACDGEVLFIGAMATHSEIAASPDVNRYFKALAMACGQVGSQQIRNRGTIGGNIVTGSPAGDTIPCLYLFDAHMMVLRASGTPEIVPIAAFAEGIDKLYHGDILIGVELLINKGIESTYIKLARREAVSIAELSMAARWTKDGGTILQPKAYLGAAGRFPMEVAAFGELDGCKIDDIDPEYIAGEAEAMIAHVRENRKRPPRLRLTEAEKLYKERAVKGVIYDVIERMK